ncbi:hypothetical protein ACFE04_002934 [Oxalis oulophora]
MMFDCPCFYWKRIVDFSPLELRTFSLPAPIPQWPPGGGFSSGRINLGELEVIKISNFEFLWSTNESSDPHEGVSFYKPVGIPNGFYCLSHYCQSNNEPLRGYVLVARPVTSSEPAPLQKPLDYRLIWSSDDGDVENHEGLGFFWLPQPPEGYKPTGYLVTNTSEKPDLDEVRCVRADLSDECQAYRILSTTRSKYLKFPFRVWSTRPSHRGMHGRGVHVGSFYCSCYWNSGEELCIACLKNLDPSLHAMPNLNQIHAIINHYGPTIFFHPSEIYLPSSVSWFFKNGALLYRAGNPVGEPIDTNGSNLPAGGGNDRQFWVDLPNDDRREKVKQGNLESAKLYVHVKPAVGGTFTDIVMWVFCPFNGPGTIKIGVMNLSLSKIGEHVGDWEHFTLRVCNFTGELWGIYFSQHSGGVWVEADDLEYIEGNKAVIYSSRNGHASYSRAGTYIQGSAKLGLGVRNDCARSNKFIDSSQDYEIVAAQYLGNGNVPEPNWLQFMREWGPKIVYDSRNDLNKIINYMPLRFRSSVEGVFNKLPVELYGEEGPTGPKEKNNWVGDERS